MKQNQKGRYVWCVCIYACEWMYMVCVCMCCVVYVCESKYVVCVHVYVWCMCICVNVCMWLCGVMCGVCVLLYMVCVHVYVWCMCVCECKYVVYVRVRAFVGAWLCVCVWCMCGACMQYVCGVCVYVLMYVCSVCVCVHVCVGVCVTLLAETPEDFLPVSQENNCWPCFCFVCWVLRLQVCKNTSYFQLHFTHWAQAVFASNLLW